LYETLAEAWEILNAGGQLAVPQRAMLWLASTHAATTAKQATELALNAGGSASPYENTGLGRCMRDIHAVGQHITLAPDNYQMAGQALLSFDMRATALLSRDNRGSK
jgi:hypothetical protein